MAIARRDGEAALLVVAQELMISGELTCGGPLGCLAKAQILARTGAHLHENTWFTGAKTAAVQFRFRSLDRKSLKD